MRLLNAALLGVGLLATSPAVVPQPSEIRGVVKGEGGVRIPLAIPNGVAPGPGSLAALGTEIHETLVADLVYSGYFDIVDPSRYDGLQAPTPERHDLTAWRATGAEAVLSSRVLQQGEQIALEGRLFDTASAEMVLGKRYAGQTDLARRIAHRLSSDVTAHFTGQPGVSLSRIAFVSQHEGAKEIYVMDYDGQRVRRMTTTGTINLNPVWSPDGSRLAFLSFRQKYPGIYILEADGRITPLPTGGGDLNSAPDWSPDGKLIAYSSTRDGNCEIYTMDLATSRVRRLTQEPGIDTSPSWSPTGREMAFTSDRGGTPQIYVMDAEGVSLRRLTFEGPWNDSPAWSPKGDRIAYVCRTEGKFALMLLDLVTQRTAKILAGPFNCADPRWSADARHITFASDTEGRYNIHVIDPDGSNFRRLTRGEASFTPDWSR